MPYVIGALIVIMPFIIIGVIADGSVDGAGIFVALLILSGCVWFMYKAFSNAAKDKKEGITRVLTRKDSVEMMRTRRAIRAAYKEPYGDEAQKAVAEYHATLRFGPR